jgi:hypothetical protein
MLQPDVYWLRELEGVRFVIMPRPRSGEWLSNEIAGWNRLGVQTVVSLLESQEVRELDVADEQSLCQGANIQFVSFPISDRGVPSNSVVGVLKWSESPQENEGGFACEPILSRLILDSRSVSGAENPFRRQPIGLIRPQGGNRRSSRSAQLREFQR